MPSNSWLKWVIGFLLALIAIAYWNAPAGEFVYDDTRQIVDNHLIQSPALFGEALTSDVWSFKADQATGVSNYYRPVFVAALIAQYQLFGISPTGWHIVNIIVHACASLLLLLFLLYAGFHKGLAAIASWVFAVHPVHVESVTWVSGLPDPLMAAFLFGSLALYARWRMGLNAIRWVAIIGLFLLSLGSKEVAIAAIPIVFSLEAALRLNAGDSKGIALKRALVNSLPFIAATVLFFAVRTYALKDALPQSVEGVGASNILATAPVAIAFYLRQAIWPFDLAPTHGVRMVTSMQPTLIISIVVVVAAIALLLSVARKNRLAWVAAALFAIPLAPALNIKLFPPEDIVRDRYIYLPIAGVVLILGMLFLQLLRNDKTEQEPAPLRLGLFAAPVLLGLSVLTMMYTRVWSSSVALWERGVAANPQGSFAWVHLSDAYRAAGERRNAIRAAEKAVEVAPQIGEPHLALGMALEEVNRSEEAARAYEGILEDRAVGGAAAGRLARIYSASGRTEDAVNVLRHAAEVEPGQADVHLVNIAVIHGMSGDLPAAQKVLEEVRPRLVAGSQPDALRGLVLLGDVYRQSGRVEDAVACYREFLTATQGASSPMMLELRNTAEGHVQALSG